MSTFQLNLNLNKSQPCDKNKFHLTKRSQGQSALAITQKGLNQAHRNDSTDMYFFCQSRWKLIHGWEEQTQADSYIQSSVRPYDFVNEEENDKSFKRSERHPISTLKNSSNPSPSNRTPSPQSNLQDRLKVDTNPDTSKQKQSKSQTRKNQSINKLKQNPLKSKNEQQLVKYENLEKMNQEIKKYLERQKFASRSLSNSAFAKLYNKPCVQSYGFGNTSADSQAVNNLLKTHNITPHTNQNNPQTYQSYKTALLFAKRSRIDQEDKQQRLRRQFLRFFDDSVVQAARIELLKKNQERKTKSDQKMKKRYEKMSKREIEESDQALRENKQRRKSLKQTLGSNEPIFVYRHTDRQGHMRISSDRHGLTCYVDSGYHANEKALVQFQKKQRPILPQKVKQEDMNLDQIRKQNLTKSVEECHPCHYLVPCVEAPYDKSKYQFMRKRAESMVN